MSDAADMVRRAYEACEFGQCVTLRDGRVLELIAYPDWESAAEAAGVDLDRV